MGTGRGRVRAWIVALACLIAPAPGVAADVSNDEKPGAAAEAEEEAVEPGSPRAALTSYLELVRAGEYDAASAYLQLPRRERERGPAIAERLKFVLERHGVDPGAMSPKAEGDKEDGLPMGVDRVALVSTPPGDEPVLMVRSGNKWLFARQSVGRVDAWYHGLDERWLLEHLPPPLLRSGPFGLLWWQWGALAVLVLMGWLAGVVLGRATIGGLKRVVARTPKDVYRDLLAHKRGPVTLLWATGVCWLLLPLLDLYPAAERTLTAILRLTLYVALFWAFTRTADVLASRMVESDWARRNKISESLITLGVRSSKIVLLGVAIVGLLAQLGYPVASLIAGFGVGGVILALAAQRTVENLLGALVLAVDQPFRPGDLVRLGDQLGTVEVIGLRSTRIRTLDRTLIVIPNGKLAAMSIESLAARDCMRFNSRIRLAYDTSASQLRRVLNELTSILRRHDSVANDSIDVHFVGYGSASLDLEVTAYFETRTFRGFLAIQQDVLLQFMDAIEAAGTTLALPTQTLRVTPPADERDLTSRSSEPGIPH